MQRKTRIKKDASYGVIPIFKDSNGALEVLVIHQKGSKGDVYWGFPKGHSEAGESEADAALRELQEETGITNIVLDADCAFTQRYTFMHRTTRINKMVTYFVGYVKNKRLTLDADELHDAQWCSLTNARKLLTHQGTKKMFDQIIAHLKKQ